ncbi:MAG: hypothetical protein KKB37_00605 [Alphaproteobacteria bacterium]|nr:hypothetical protein [Alphaproteobacteria bacterium]
MINLQSFVAMASLSVVMVSAAAGAGPLELLPGRWSGWGHMTMDGGDIERVKCIATYFSEAGGRELRHNLRCASTNYRIDATARLSISGGRVSGEWVERTYAAGGTVSGSVKGDGLVVNITGETFKAVMTIEADPCMQKMNIAPTGMGVSRIAVTLSKC